MGQGALPLAGCLHCGAALPAKRRFCSARCYAEKRACRIAARDVSGSKRCSKCSRTLRLDAFSPAASQPNRKAGWCRDCKSRLERERRKRPHVVASHRARMAGDQKYRAAILVKGLRKRARAEGLECDIDAEWVLARIPGGCELTGLPFDLSTGRIPRAPSVDRIHAGGPYLQKNCRLVLLVVNLALQNWGLEEFIPIARALSSRYT